MEESKSAPAFRSFMDDLRWLLTPEDYGLVSAMALPIDNQNLVNVLESKGGFDPRGNYPLEELRTALKWADGLPKYMQAFLDAYKSNQLPFPGLTLIDQLSWFFYEEMAASKNAFLRGWFEFDIGLRNVAIGVNIRKGLGHIEALATERDRPAALTVVGRGDVAEAVLKSAAPDFGLSAAHSWVDKVSALSRGGLTDMEKGLDGIRWEVLSGLTTFTAFQAETVAAFVGKLMIVERWMKLEPSAGGEKLNKLVEELMESFVMPEGF
jgi:hypothetical protein